MLKIMMNMMKIMMNMMTMMNRGLGKNFLIQIYMCSENIHDELISINQYTCPFCDEFLVKIVISSDPCCRYQQIEDINGIETCISCGLVYNPISKDDYIDFHENLFRFHRKSVYIRKYHIKNTLDNLLINNRIELTYKQRCKIYKIFEQIEYILPSINEKKKENHKY